MTSEDSAMLLEERILQERILTLAKDSNDAELILKAATILKLGAEGARARGEAKDLERSTRTENLRFFVPIIAPLVSALAIVGALIFQTAQFRVTTETQRKTVDVQKQTVEVQARAAEDAQWREAVRTFSEGGTVTSHYAGIALLSGFLREGSHQEDARLLILSILGREIATDVFERLFDSAMEATPDIQKVQAALGLTKQLKQTFFQKLARQKEFGDQTSDNQSLLTTITKNGREVANPSFQAQQVYQEVCLVSKFVAPRLQSPRANQPPPDLTDSAMWECDLSSADLSAAVLERANFQNVKFDGADLDGVERFGDSVWEGTAWWRAERLSPKLLEYLKVRFPYDASQDYPDGGTSQEYETRLASLSGQARTDRPRSYAQSNDNKSHPQLNGNKKAYPPRNENKKVAQRFRAGPTHYAKGVKRSQRRRSR